MTAHAYPKPEILSRIPLDNHVVIEASAGTGKTYTIEHLFVELLLTRDASVENILVVTFTEKAATELRARVRRIIQNILAGCVCMGPDMGACWEITEELQLKLKRALFSFDKAPIHTIHGFFQRVIVEHAFLGGRLFDQTLTESQRLFSEEFLHALRMWLSRDKVSRDTVISWLSDDGSVDELVALLYKSNKKKCTIMPRLDPGTFDSDVERISRDLRTVCDPDALRDRCKKDKIHHATTKAMVSRVEKMHKALDDYALNRKGTFHIQGITIAELDDILATMGKLPDCRNQDKDAILQLQSMILSRDALVVHQYLPGIREQLHKRKLCEGLYDFDDMIGYLQDALEGAQADQLINSLRERYHYALIDESQDTDEVQWKIFRRVFYESTARNRIYLIGDPKQAIYGFRGADVQTYLEAKADICKGSDPIHLEENFRSTALLIRAHNLLLDQKAEAPFFTGQIRYEVPVRSGMPDMCATDQNNEPIAPVTIIEVRSNKDKVSSGEFKRTVGRHIAQEIQSLLTDKNIRINKKGAIRSISARDIFILTRAEREGRDVAAFLRESRIPFAFYKQDGLFQTREAEDIRDLLSAVERPEDLARRLKAWMSGFFAIPLSQLSFCKALPESHPLVEKLVAWHHLAMQRDYRTLFTRVLDESGIVLRELFLQDNERQLTNYHHILEILLEEAALASYDIADMVLLIKAFIAKTRNPTRDNGNIQRLETEKEAVQIMTLHKSKGLEAPVVFLYGGFTSPPDSNIVSFHEGHERFVYIGSGPPSSIREKVQRETEEESQRLLYVGMTRAIARLYLPYIDPARLTTKMKEGPYNQLNARVHDLLEARALPPELFRIDGAGAQAAAHVPHDAAEQFIAGDWCPDQDLPAVEDPGKSRAFESLRTDHAGFEITSYTRISHIRTHGGDDEVDDRGADGSGGSASEWARKDTIGGAAFGSAIHAIMEKISFGSLKGVEFPAWAGLASERALCSNALLKNGIDQKHLGYAQELVYNTLTTPIELNGEYIHGLCSLSEYARETEFLYPYPELGNPDLEHAAGEYQIHRGFVTGFIDLLFRVNNKVYVLDWKTDALADYSQTTMDAHVQDRYQVQVKLYVLAVLKLLRCHSRDDYEREFGGILYCFMRGRHQAGQTGSGVYFNRPRWDDILSYEQELIASTEYI